jgi:DNA-binding transcriptional MerR regulator
MCETHAGRPLVRIGELSRRLGVSDHVLRSWESRYGLLKPVRSKGGYRLYFATDESRIHRMIAYLADGLSAAEAARTVPRGASTAEVDAVLPAEHRQQCHPWSASRARSRLGKWARTASRTRLPAWRVPRSGADGLRLVLNRRGGGSTTSVRTCRSTS